MASYTWTEEQQGWLKQAQAGNDDACSSLFCSMKNVLEVVHRYSQDGQYPARFGYDYNFNGRTFEEASGDIYFAFRDAVRRFDADQGVPFGAYAVRDLRHRAMDWTRNRQNDRHVLVGQRLSCTDDGNGEFSVLSQAHYDESVNGYYAEKSDSLCDEEAHPVEYCEVMDMVSKIRRDVVANGDPRLVEFVGFYLEHCLEKKAMEEIAERMGVTRAMVYVYMDKLRELIVPKYGADFGIAA